MATSTYYAFEEFAELICLTSAQKDLVKSRRDVTHRLLEKSFGDSSNMPVLRTYLIGSAQRGTIVRPLDDVDMIAVFDHTNVWEGYGYRNDSSKFLYRVRNNLDAQTEVRTGARGQVVRLFYKQKPHVDVVPAFSREGGGYLIPGGSGTWLSTDPDRQADYMARRHRELNYNLKGLVRMLKHWNRAHSSRFQSFHLEALTAAAFVSLGSNVREAAQKFFAHARYNIDVNDPGGHSGNLAGYLTNYGRSQVLNSLDSALDRASRALDAERDGNHAEAIRLWKIVFGNWFPSYG